MTQAPTIQRQARWTDAEQSKAQLEGVERRTRDSGSVHSGDCSLLDNKKLIRAEWPSGTLQEGSPHAEPIKAN